MRPFAYARPETLEGAFDLLDRHGPDAKLLAGGTDVIVRLRLGLIKPGILVDLKRLFEIRADIIEVEGCLRIGAHAVMTTIVADERIQRAYPALVEAARVVGSVQIRNRATLAGNICNASPAADTAPALLVYEAIVNIASRGGLRQVPLASFFSGPGRTALRTGEIVLSLDLPLPRAANGSSFGRVTRRRGVDLATVNVCCLVTAAGATRFAYGAVAPTPLLLHDDTGVLSHGHATATSRDAAIDRLIGRASPISDVRGGRDYRLAMLDVMSRRTLHTALERLRTATGSALS